MGIAISTNFGDLLDPRFQKIFHERYDELADMIPKFFSFPTNNGRSNMTWSSVGELADWPAFNGTVVYQQANQGYDITATHKEFASGVQIERKLFDDDQYQIMDARPSKLARAAQRKRQKDAARIFNNAFSVDTEFYSNSEGVALCSNSHTTTATGVSTASGFDNLGTSALSAVAVTAARIQFVDFRDDAANKISLVPDGLIIPTALYGKAFEIVASMGVPDNANNARNVHESAWDVTEWNYLSDNNNWFMEDSSFRKENLHWLDRIPIEFAFAEDIDTMIAKWRGYMRYSSAWTDWRWILGAQVS